MKKDDFELYSKLMRYSDSDYYPFHMPGHKRQVEHPLLQSFPNPYAIDITEIYGFDNLHHPEEVIRKSMNQIATIYGADRSYYLVNGSSCGILSAICGTTHNSDTILMSRNCHKAAYHGVFLNQLNVKYTYPQLIDEYGIQGGLKVEEIEDMLKTFVDISSMFVVSPTYDGIVSDIQKISTICHNYGIPLIVDEAHGAHFRYGDDFPVSALELGADIVIQSLHKTLPSFTQTAVMHVKEGYVDIQRLEHYLQIFQSSSPSYLFMAGMEQCVQFMESEGENGGRLQMVHFQERLKALRAKLKKMKHLRILDESVVGCDGVYDVDISKIIISTKETGISGEDLEEWLRDVYHLEMEMSGVDYVTAITTLMDTEKGLNRLQDALLKIDEEIDQKSDRYIQVVKKEDYVKKSDNFHISNRVLPKQSSMTIHEAWNHRKKSVLIEESVGQISGEYIYVYPPGIPLVVPGEVIDQDVVDTVVRYKENGLSIQGLKDYSAEIIDVVNC